MSAPGDAGERPIRVLIAKLGLDGHDVGAKAVCRALMDAGMDVTYTGLRQTPEDVAEAIRAQRPDVLGLSILSGAHLPLCRRMKAALEERGVEAPLWIVGGNIPRRDVAALEELGVRRVFPVGTPFETIVGFIRQEARP